MATENYLTTKQAAQLSGLSTVLQELASVHDVALRDKLQRRREERAKKTARTRREAARCCGNVVRSLSPSSTQYLYLLPPIRQEGGY
jgi:hypothetical protein